jgi:hypothetical protein
MNTSSTKAPAFRFQSRANAWAFAPQGRANAVVLGNDGLHWVVTLAQAATLERQGYTVEYLPC